MTAELDLANKTMLAPMVRVGTLPLRLLSLESGCDVVYTSEVIAYKLRHCERRENAVLGTVDFWKGKELVLRTNAADSPCLCQIGTPDATLALEAARVVERDFDAIDINMGCPKRFSMQAEMGAALLKKPLVACDIIKTLRRNLSVPVTCKIRLLDSVQHTVDLVTSLAQAGASAIAIHARETHERPREPAQWSTLRSVVEACGASVGVPLIGNGDVYKYADIERMRTETGVSSVMIARGVLEDLTIFSPPAPGVTHETQVRKLLWHCIRYNGSSNSKYTLQRVLMHTSKSERERFQAIQRSKSLVELEKAVLGGEEAMWQEHLKWLEKRKAEVGVVEETVVDTGADFVDGSGTKRLRQPEHGGPTLDEQPKRRQRAVSADAPAPV